MTDILKIDFEIRDIKLTWKEIDRFEILENRRHIRHTQMESILTALRNGRHFRVPIVINIRAGKMRIIDGNHRFEALRIFLTEDKSRAIIVRFNAYTDLDSDGETQAFITWNLGIKHTIDDLLNLRRYEIPIWEYLLKKGLQISHLRNIQSNAVPFSLVVKMLYGSFNTGKVFTPRNPRRTSVVEIAKEFTLEQGDMSIAFFHVFENAIGEFRYNKFLRTVFCQPAFNIYQLNQWRFGDEELVERFAKCVTDSEIKQLLFEHSADAVMRMRRRIIDVMNRGERNKVQGGELRVESNGAAQPPADGTSGSAEVES